ncbi:MAG: SPOR domain-containing protein [Neisseriaceae bacterium]|nr:SPOR domain-containing protein [Neisseriaceae bacterium]
MTKKYRRVPTPPRRSVNKKSSSNNGLLWGILIGIIITILAVGMMIAYMNSHQPKFQPVTQTPKKVAKPEPVKKTAPVTKPAPQPTPVEPKPQTLPETTATPTTTPTLPETTNTPTTTPTLPEKTTTEQTPIIAKQQTTSNKKTQQKQEDELSQFIRNIEKEQKNKPTTPTKVASNNATQNNAVLQIGSFTQREQAEAQRAKLSMLGINSHIESAQVNNRTIYRVRSGRLNSQQLQNARKRLQDNQIDSIILPTN